MHTRWFRFGSDFYVRIRIEFRFSAQPYLLLAILPEIKYDNDGGDDDDDDDDDDTTLLHA